MTNLAEVEFLFDQRLRQWAKDWVNQKEHVRHFCFECQMLMVQRGERGTWIELMDSPVYVQILKYLRKQKMSLLFFCET